MLDDTELLRRYIHERSESAFAELVQRHIKTVYLAALRRFDGRPFCEIASQLRLTEATARKRLERALERLRRRGET